MLFKSKHNIEFPDISVYQFIFEGDKEFSQDKLAFVNSEDKSESITFGELKNLTLRFGAGLQRLTDFKKGDVVAIYSPNDVS
jgi:acyl-coenzyme A synthetase/AMP-(fatty) acid ligase